MLTMDRMRTELFVRNDFQNRRLPNHGIVWQCYQWVGWELSCLLKLGIWPTHKNNMCGHACHLLNTQRKLMILKTGDYPTMDLYGNASKKLGGD